MALAGGVVYAAANNLCDVYSVPSKSIVGQKFPNPTTGTGNFEALSLTTGKVLWNTKLPSSPYGAATVTNDLEAAHDLALGSSFACATQRREFATENLACVQ